MNYSMMHYAVNNYFFKNDKYLIELRGMTVAITTLDVLPKSIILNKTGDIVVGGTPALGQNPRGKVLPLGPSGFVLGSNGQNPVWLPYSLTPGTVTSVSVISPSLDLNIVNSTVTTVGTISIDLMPTGVTAGTYNSPAITIDDKGRITQVASGSSLGTQTILHKTSDYSILPAESGIYYSNEGSSGTVVLSLPDVVAGLTYKFCVAASHVFQIVASGASRIHNGAYVTALGGSIQASMVGSFISLVAINAIDWIAEESVGVWDNGGVFVLTDSGDLVVTYDMLKIGINKTVSEITTVTLPSSPFVGETHNIKDSAGVCALFPITVDGGIISIDGSLTFVMDNNYQAIEVYYDGTMWNII